MEQTIEQTGRLDTFYLDYPKQMLQMTKTPEVNVLLINVSGLTNHAIDSEQMPFVRKIAGKSYRFMHHYASGDTPMASTLGIFYGLSGRYIDAVLNEKTSSPLMTAFKKIWLSIRLILCKQFC